CVQQGWLKQAGEIALCLPNQVSVELSNGKSSYDSLNY
ncbi:MAG: NusG domain II-containing protein, partial [Candidatus Nitrotoga sp.]